MKMFSALLLATALTLSALLHPFKFLLPSKDHVALKVIQSIVKITGTRDDGEPEVCTGFVVGKTFILTANHCFADKLSQDGIPAEVVKRSEGDDLMLLSTRLLGKRALTLREKPVEKYEELTGIGYGWGWERPLVLAEMAIFTNFSPNPGMLPGIFVQGGYVPGMSGGPLVDRDGKVVGIIQQSNANVGYGVGTDRILEFLGGLTQ